MRLPDIGQFDMVTKHVIKREDGTHQHDDAAAVATAVPASTKEEAAAKHKGKGENGNEPVDMDIDDEEPQIEEGNANGESKRAAHGVEAPTASVRTGTSTAVQVRAVPQGYEKIPVASDGNCLFEAIVQAYNHYKQDEDPENTTAQTHRQLRAACAGNLRKYATAWERWWDGKDPSNRACANFGADDDIVNQLTTWGGNIETEACARVLRVRIYVLPEDPELEPVTMNGNYKTNATIFLWYTGTHYDWLKPNKDTVISSDFLLQFLKNKRGSGGRGGVASSSASTARASSAPRPPFGDRQHEHANAEKANLIGTASAVGTDYSLDGTIKETVKRA